MGATHRLLSRSSSISAPAKAGIFLVLVVCGCNFFTPLMAQTNVNVQVGFDKPVNVITTESVGVYTDIYDGNTVNPKVAAYLRAGGVGTIQFPGGYGSYADLYHWTTGNGTK